MKIELTGSSRIEFLSYGVRRLSNNYGNVEAVVGFMLHPEAADTKVIFILDTQCNYEATLTIDLMSTITLVGFFLVNLKA